MNANKPARKSATERMVTEDLGYCCTYIFFTRFRTGDIQHRLGISHSTASNWKAKVACGEVVCGGGPRCMKAALFRKKT